MKVRLFEDGEPVDLTISAGEIVIESAEGSRRVVLRQIAGDAFEGAIRIDERSFRFLARRSGSRVQVALRGESFEFDLAEATDSRRGGHRTATPETRSPMPGKVLQVSARVGDKVVPGDPLVILEAMKMENVLVAEVEGEVAAVHVEAGEMVEPGKLLVVVTPAQS